MKSPFSIRTAVFSIVLAIALWTLVSLRSSYDVVTSVPLEFALPSNRSIEMEVPREVRLKLRATGWHLVNLLYLNADSRCVIDLSSQTETTNQVGVKDILQGFRSPVPTSVLEVLSREFTVQLGIVGVKRVALIPDIELQPTQGFSVIGLQQLTPDSVTLRGNVKLLESISVWKTKRKILANLKEEQAFDVVVSDSLSAILQVEPHTARYLVDVQRSAEIQLDDIPVHVVGGTNPSSHQLSPTCVSVTLRGGVDQIDAVSREDVSVTVDVNQLIRDSTGTIIPTVRAPQNMQVLKLQPESLIHWKSLDNGGKVKSGLSRVMKSH